ncbi:MAG: hypothetical protein ACE5HU_09890 [Acidobacteriota bacterium]
MGSVPRKMKTGALVGMVPKDRADRHLVHNLHTLGLQAGASAEDVAVAYFTRRRALEESDSVEAEQKLSELEHAFRIIKSRYKSYRHEVVRRRVNRSLVACVLILLVLSVISWLQVGDRLRARFTSFRPGDHLSLMNEQKLYGEVVGYDEHHRFLTGVRDPAYEVRLNGLDTPIWISATAAHKAFRKR